MKMLDCLLNRPFTLEETHISAKEVVVGQPVKLQAVIRRRWHAHHKPLNIHLELHDANDVCVAKKQAYDLKLCKGELFLIEWDYVIPEGIDYLKLKVGVFNKDYTETLSWWNPCGQYIEVI